MLVAYSAFDQFEVHRLVNLHIFDKIDLSITNSSLFLIISLLYFIFLIKYSGIETGYLVPSR